MPKDFFAIEYLLYGSELQRKGYAAIKNTNVLDTLYEFDPVLAGTLPLDIFIKGSDLDILCYAIDLSVFEKILTSNFSKHQILLFTKQRSKKSTLSSLGFMHWNLTLKYSGNPCPREIN